MDIEITDSVLPSEGTTKGELKPVNHWDGPWIEKTNEHGEKILVPAVNFSEKDIDIWKQAVDNAESNLK